MDWTTGPDPQTKFKTPCLCEVNNSDWANSSRDQKEGIMNSK